MSPNPYEDESYHVPPELDEPFEEFADEDDGWDPGHEWQDSGHPTFDLPEDDDELPF